MELEDGKPSVHVGLVDVHPAVEPPGAHQGRVDELGPVGGADEHDPLRHGEAVELDQELVEGVVELPVPPDVRAAAPAHGVELVDEDDRRRVLLGLLEELAHPGGSDAHVDLDEAGGRDRVEGHARLAGERPGEQGLAAAGRAVEQHAAGKLGPQRLEALRVGEVVLDLLELGDHLVQPGDVGEGDGRLVGGELDPLGGERAQLVLHLFLGHSQCHQGAADDHHRGDKEHGVQKD